MPPPNVQAWELLKRAGNDAVEVNPSVPATSHLTRNGSSWLWAVFSVYGAVLLGIIAWTMFIPRGRRVFHHMAIMILTIDMVAYFGQASNLGFTVTPTEFGHYSPIGTLRQIWWARWVAETLTWPLLLAMLALATALPLSDIIQAAFWGAVTMVCMLLGALVRTTYKWGFFAIGGFALLMTLWYLFGPILSGARVMGRDYKSLMLMSAAYLGVILLLYPVAWGCSEGGNVISVTSEFIWYGILDVLAKPFFLAGYLFMLSRLDLTKLHLQSAKYTNTAPDNVVLSLANAHTAETATATAHTHGAHTHAHGDSHSLPRASNDTYVQEKSRKGFFTKKGKYDANDTATGNRHTGAETLTTSTIPPPATSAPAYAQTTGHGTGLADGYGTGHGTGHTPGHTEGASDPRISGVTATETVGAYPTTRYT